MPEVHELARQLEKQPFTALLIHAATTTTRPRSRPVPAETVLPEFLPRHQITLPVAVATRADFVAYDVDAIPVYVLIDRKGRVRYQKAGRLPPETLIRELLAE